jgi:putative inorganic carbon (HCO3(-)) transporter
MRNRTLTTVLGSPLPALAAYALFASADVFHPYMLAGYALLALPWLVRAGRRGSALDAPLALLALTALAGAWLAWDAESAWRAAGLLLVSLAVCASVIEWANTPQRLVWSGAATAGGAALLGVYYVTQRDWSAAPAKFGALAPIGVALNRVIPNLGLHAPHPNIVAGVLVVGFFAGVGLWSDGRGLRPALCAGLLAIAFALLMTASRSSWLALGAVLGLWALWRVVGAWRPPAARWLPASVLGGAVLVGAALAVLAPPDWRAGVVRALVAQDTGAVRLVIWPAAAALVRDMPYSGAGVGAFSLVYAVYAQVAPGPIVPHAHNLYLQFAVEQGVFGACALAGLLLVTARQAWRRGAPQAPVARAGLWAALALALVWLLDAPGYADRAAPFLFVPLGLAWAGWANDDHAQVRGVGPALLALCAVAALAVGGDPRSALPANVGALLQARAELPAYRDAAGLLPWSACATFDDLDPTGLSERERRACFEQPDLALLVAVRAAPLPGEEWLRAAPDRFTAAERLGALALARGAYAQAQAWLAAARARGDGTRAAALLYAQALACGGAHEAALAVAREVAGGEAYLETASALCR